MTPAIVKKILKRSPSGMFQYVMEASMLAGTFQHVHEEVPEGSVFSGLDLGTSEGSFGPFKASRWFSGIEGTWRKVEYTRPDGRKVSWVRRPYSTWEGPFDHQ